jgi:hypothetical protein
MNLMNLVRSIGFLAIGWTVLALGVGALGVWSPSPPAVNYFVPKPSLQQVVTINPAKTGGEQIRLVDQVTGRSEAIRLPSDKVWALLTVLPWRDRDGNLEVVGRWARHLDSFGEQAYSGLGRFRLSDATELSLVSLDTVPTGRPCVLPVGPGEILFPSGDGRLYRCNLSENSHGDAGLNIRSEQVEEAAITSSARPIGWHCERPGAGEIYMNDPVWSPEPRVREYVFVSLSTQTRNGTKVLQKRNKLWWLKMNHGYDEIQAAGPLYRPVAMNPATESVEERFPAVAVDALGRLSLYYMTRGHREKAWRLCSARLELDPRTGGPHGIPSETAAGAIADGLAAEPPLISADGKRVFAMATTGELRTIKLAEDR